jgi:thiamine biosynthesis lipoprotein
VSDHTASFGALGTTATVITTEATALDRAVEAVRTELELIDRTCSRFRPDSELSALNASAGHTVAVSPLLLLAVQTARWAAEATDGCVDPTLGASMRALGYDRDFRSVPQDGDPLQLRLPSPAGWEAVRVDPAAATVFVPAGVELDLGATAKALAVDRSVAAAAQAAGAPVLVSIGGDLAVGGPARPDGWPVLVTDDHAQRDDRLGQVVTLDQGGLATSGTTVRRWRRGGVELHHLLDPRTGRPARSCWRTATVAAGSCVDANVAATAAVVLGADAPAWLTTRRLPGRLVSVDGCVETVAGWPTDDRDAMPGPVRW